LGCGYNSNVDLASELTDGAAFLYVQLFWRLAIGWPRCVGAPPASLVVTALFLMQTDGLRV
jgi:hypothetical protein